MNAILKRFIHKASVKKALLFTALFAAMYVIINFSPIGVAGLLAITGGPSILDFEFGYTYEKAFELLTALGADGRAFYQSRIVPVDFPFPFSYMLFYAGWMALCIKRLEQRDWHKYLLILPILAMMFDWVENIGIIAMLNSYPPLPSWAVALASVSGVIKALLTAGCIAMVLLLFFLSLYSNRRRKQ